MRRSALLIILISLSFLVLEAETYTFPKNPAPQVWPVLLIEFEEDNYSYSTGNGKFLTDSWVEDDTSYVVDLIPHNKDYFKAHQKFVSNYWTSNSDGRIYIDTSASPILPANENAFLLSNQMRYYAYKDSLDTRLARLVYEAVYLAEESGNHIPLNDGIMIYHAGVGQDFSIALDNTPFDIPSFYFDEDYLITYLSEDQYAYLRDHHISQGIVLPEYQSQVKTNIALNGTEIMLSGYLLGLPSLYDTKRGYSQAGVFGLMDQGSNNGGGLLPIKPSAFERIFLGTETASPITAGGTYSLAKDQIYKIPITSTEYFLLEYRKNTGLAIDSLYSSLDHLKSYADVLSYLDSLGHITYTMQNGVITSISDYDVSLPGSGLLIWHIDETSIDETNPNAIESPFLNLVEADGGDDIGKYYSTFDTRIMQGWKWDMWFKNNPGFMDNNPNEFYVHWGDGTNPDSRSFNLASTGIAMTRIRDIADSLSVDLVINNNISTGDGTSWYSGRSSDHTLLGSRDSSIILQDSQGDKTTLYTHTDAILPENTSLVSLPSEKLAFLSRSDDATDIFILDMNGDMVYEQNFPHVYDIDKSIFIGDSICLLPEDPSDPLAYFSFGSHSPFPFINSELPDSAVSMCCNNGIYISSESQCMIVNDHLLTLQDDGGFIYRDTLYAENMLIRSLIPLAADAEGQHAFAVLGDMNEDEVFALLTEKGYMDTRFPISGSYTALRAFYRQDELYFAAYSPEGILDIYNTAGDMTVSYPAPSDAKHIFMEQTQADTALLMVDATTYEIPADSILWAYESKTIYNHKNIHFTPTITSASGDGLIRDGYVYNYPNPIDNGETRFRFYADRDLDVQIKIYYLSGRYTGTMLTKTVCSGQWHELLWEVGDLQSGVYLAQVTVKSGDSTETYIIKPAILK